MKSRRKVLARIIELSVELRRIFDAHEIAWQRALRRQTPAAWCKYQKLGRQLHKARARIYPELDTLTWILGYSKKLNTHV